MSYCAWPVSTSEPSEEREKLLKTLRRMKRKTKQKVCYVAKAVLPDQFIAVNAYINKEGRSQISHLNFYLKKLEKKSKLNPKPTEGNNDCRRISEIGNRKTVENTN